MTLSGFSNGILEVFEPGALNCFAFFHPTLLTLPASRNPISTQGHDIFYQEMFDFKWVSNLMFFADFCEHLNGLNVKLQGGGKTLDVTFGYIKAFEKN